MNLGLILLFASVLAIAFTVVKVRRSARRPAAPDDLMAQPFADDIKPRIQVNQYPKEDPCRPLDQPDIPYASGGVCKDEIMFALSDDDPPADFAPYSASKELCQAIQEAARKLSDLPAPGAPEIPSVVSVTPAPKMTRADALKSANRNRETKGRLKAQKAKEALAAGMDPEDVAQECGYKTVKYMREKVRALDREGLPA